MSVKDRTSSPPDGWTSDNNVLSPSHTVRGYMLRRQEVEGVCHSQSCRRRFTLDMARFQRRGWEGMTMGELEALYRCNAIEGCAFRMSRKTAPLTMKLGSLVGFDNVRVRVTCGSCEKIKLAKPESIIAGLAIDGRGGHDTQVKDLSLKMKRPCPGCGKTDWQIDILWVRTDTSVWKAQGERMFDAMLSK